MQWSKGTNLGFSVASPAQLYLPVDPAPDAPTVEAQEQDSQSLLHRTRALIRLRHSQPALSAYAEFVPINARKNTYPLIYCRAKDSDVVLVILNPGQKTASAEFAFQVPYARLTLLAGKAPDIFREGEKMAVKITGRSYAIYRLER